MKTWEYGDETMDEWEYDSMGNGNENTRNENMRILNSFSFPETIRR